MEKLKSLIPTDLKRMIADSTPENLTSTCNSLLDFFRPLPQFQLVLGELTDPATALCRKSREAALDSKGKGNGCFSKGDYAKALSFYCQALRYAPINHDTIDMSLVATLYVNRASAMHKLGLPEECIRDCNLAIALSPDYAKAWYRRGMANAALRNYQVAICDLEVSLSMEDSSYGKKHIKEELEMLASHSNSGTNRNSSYFNDEDLQLAALVKPPHTVLECVSTLSKGRGMASPNDVLPASLVHCEEPLAAIVMKSCRETHCHFCFNEVPTDVLFCSSCTIPIYCSRHCQELAGGEQFPRNQNGCAIEKHLSVHLEKHVMDIISPNHNKCAVADLNFKHIPEHRHECGGANWPAVLPPDVILAGRVMMKFIEKRKVPSEYSNSREILEFAHNYIQVPSEIKLEFHVYAVVLSYCLQHYYNSDFPATGASVAQLVVLLSQIRINSIAVVHMRSLDGQGAFKKSLKLSAVEDASICTVEQVRVGQAIYSTGSLFNHSCQPNIHAYFLSRTLFLRSTEFVPAWYPLELSYGPQVGQSDLPDRQELLKEQYSFNCQCSSCSKLNLPDLVINAFRCPKPDCLGAVSEKTHYEKLEDDILRVSGASYSYRLSVPVMETEKNMSKVASIFLQKTCDFCHLGPGYCLSCCCNQDLKPSSEVSKRVITDIKRLKNSIISNVDPATLISDALKSLNRLRSVRHPYSTVVAQAEDNMAEIFVRIGDFERAIHHCIASIEILEKLHNPKHIVVAHELMKLASIQLSLGDRMTALSTTERLEAIFSLYYGPHSAKIFPYVEGLKREADNIAL